MREVKNNKQNSSCIDCAFWETFSCTTDRPWRKQAVVRVDPTALRTNPGRDERTNPKKMKERNQFLVIESNSVLMNSLYDAGN